MTVHAGGLVEVVGESHRQDVLKRLAGRTVGSATFLDDLSGRARKIAEEKRDGRWFRAALIHEKANEYDLNAISVWADGVGLVGYLSRDDAAEYQPMFAALRRHGCETASCPAFLIGGEPGKPSYGVMLCLSSPERIVSDLTDTPLG
ncbi:hypothetical protein Gocc_0479 [Gaiella occulta]|uniref:HIRAN domain-containing protein n=1 Tax=Gaiella occulta TaxID=1002870 RepID=A0A7M2Z191_9ACTN|nr:hypothetical protein [Gaiella occulta]RDI76060.1 hypothetical protein Gocc_0479 [Gaiella occulta]